jgi:hypothetical protein
LPNGTKGRKKSKGAKCPLFLCDKNKNTIIKKIICKKT